jgi:hypothetical protein
MYLPILGFFLLSVITLVYDDLYGTPVEGSIQHGNVRYVHPCVHERLLTVYQILLSYLLPRLLNAASVNDRPSLNTMGRDGWEAGYRIPSRFSLT